MKTLIMAIILLVAGTAGFSQTKKSAHHRQHHGNMAKKYTCPMHPEVVRRNPGKCPKCHMKLVAVKKTKIQSEEQANKNKMEKM